MDEEYHLVKPQVTIQEWKIIFQTEAMSLLNLIGDTVTKFDDEIINEGVWESYPDHMRLLKNRMTELQSIINRFDEGVKGAPVTKLEGSE